MILLDCDLTQLRALAQETGQLAFRGDQLYRGLLAGLHVEEISTLPKAWAMQLRARCDADQGVTIERDWKSDKIGRAHV